MRPGLRGRASQLDISGECESYKVSPRQAQALVLALHELAANATKYGALSTTAGRVSIHYEAGPASTLKIFWQESGGPPVLAPPDRRGFGTRLLERGLAQDLGPGSVVQLLFEPSDPRAMIHFTPGKPV